MQPPVTAVMYVENLGCTRHHVELDDPEWTYRDRVSNGLHIHEHVLPVFEAVKLGTIISDGIDPLTATTTPEYRTLSVEISKPGSAYDPDQTIKILATGPVGMVGDMLGRIGDVFTDYHSAS